MTVLLTGFEPFEGAASNPSWDAVSLLSGVTIAGRQVVARPLPVSFARAAASLEAAVDEVRPTVLISVGLAGGRPGISLERVAINVDDARIADNDGARPVDAAVAADGPAAYFSTLPVKAILRDLMAAGIPASVSQTAGTFVCNHVFYAGRHLAERHFPAMRVGFVHVPYAPADAARHPGAPSMSVETVAAALRIGVATTLATDTDALIAAGATH